MKPIKILFASIPFDGHFNPLTGLAAYLKNCGHDVRWYTQSIYESKITKLGLDHYPFRKCVQYNQYNLDDIFPERLRYNGQVSRLNIDLINAFVNRAPEFFDDICEINQSFPFDVMIADVMFTAIPLVAEKLKKPILTMGIIPLVESSRDIAPGGLGLPPAASIFGRMKNDVLRFLCDNVLFRKSNDEYRRVLAQYGIEVAGNTMDFLVKSSTFFLQSGTPGFEYQRSDLGKNVRFIGALQPTKTHRSSQISLHSKLQEFDKVILVTQGTIEKDPEKLLVTVLEAYQQSDYLVVATTGGSKTDELRKRFPYHNVVIEDFIPFEEILGHASVFITNGGYGGVMLSIENYVPMVVAGVHEGKNEINTRVEYFGLGKNLKTERPSRKQITRAVEEVIGNPTYKSNVKQLGNEFRQYDPYKLSELYLYEAVGSSAGNVKPRTRPRAYMRLEETSPS